MLRTDTLMPLPAVTPAGAPADEALVATPRPPRINLVARAQNLASIRLLARLPAHTRLELERRCAWRIYEAGAPIIDPASESRNVYFLVTGAAREIGYSSWGREIILRDFKPGDCFGAIAALDGKPHGSAVAARLTSLVGSLPGRVLEDVLNAHPGVARALIAGLADMVRDSAIRIMELCTHDVPRRIYAELLRGAAAGGRGDHPNRVRLQPIPTHAEIAARVSASRETVARTLNDLSRQGLLAREHRALVLLDVAALRRMIEAPIDR